MTNDVIQGMRPTAWRPDGTPSHFEIVEHEPYIIGADDVPPIVAPIQPIQTARMQYTITGNPIDEARGFNLRVSSLATVLAGGAVLAAFVFGASLTFWSALMWFGTVFALTWAGAFALDAMRSPGGIELLHAWRLWGFLDREQMFRHSRHIAPTPARRGWLAPVLLVLAIAWTVGFVVLVIVLVAMEQMPRGGM